MEQPNTTGLTDKEVESIYQSPREVLRPYRIKKGDYILEADAITQLVDTTYILIAASFIYDTFGNAVGSMFTLYDIYTKMTVESSFSRPLDVVRQEMVSPSIRRKLIPFIIAADSATTEAQ